MGRFLIIILCGAVMTACRHTPEALGEHNLSLGKCVNITQCQDGNCPVYKEKMTIGECDAVGGSFVPRDHKNRSQF